MQQFYLTDDLLIGRGRDRACYRHPENDGLCIKVALHTEKQTVREKHYSRYLKRKQVDTSLVTPYMYKVNTNLGEGGVFPLVRNADGETSQTLTEIISNETVSMDMINRHLRLLRRYLRNNRICVRDLSPNNIVCVMHGKRLVKLMVIDGVINPGINPLNIRLPFLIRKAQRKAWRSMEAKVKRLYDEAGGHFELHYAA